MFMIDYLKNKRKEVSSSTYKILSRSESRNRKSPKSKSTGNQQITYYSFGNYFN